MSDRKLTPAEQAVAFAEKNLGSTDYDVYDAQGKHHGYCEKFFENAYGKSGVYGSAKQNYTSAVKNKSIQSGTLPPAGAAVYFSGNPQNGHVTLSAGNGYVYSNSINGKVSKLKISDLSKKWGAEGKYLGWSDPMKAGLKGGASWSPTSGSSSSGAAGAAGATSGVVSRQFTGGNLTSSVGIPRVF